MSKNKLPGRPGRMPQKKFVRMLRWYPTREEVLLENALAQVFFGFTTQAIHQAEIGPFIADFRVKDLLIEVDGTSHLRRVDYDQRRTKYLNNRGFRVLRFRNEEILANAKTAAEKIFAMTLPHEIKTDDPVKVTVCGPLKGKRADYDRWFVAQKKT